MNPPSRVELPRIQDGAAVALARDDSGCSRLASSRCDMLTDPAGTSDLTHEIIGWLLKDARGARLLGQSGLIDQCLASAL
jgi:hypothetical protein